jgi:outer membrane protein TolC
LGPVGGRALAPPPIPAGSQPASIAPPTPPVNEQVTFQQAVDRARQQNPSVQQAAQEILRARGFLQQATAGTLPDISASIVNTTRNTSVVFNGQVVQPRNQSTLSLSVNALLFAPVQWALKAQAGDQARIAEISEAEVKRQIAIATAQAYLAIVERRRVYDANVRARDTARAHFDLAHAQRTSGAGSLLNELRAQQALSADETLVAQSANQVYQAQEALGVLLAADHPIDTNGVPTLDTPVSIADATAALPTTRADLRLAAEEIVAANRVYNDTWKEWLPSVSALFEPQDIEPASFFQNARSWAFTVQASIPIFDFGLRKGERASRLALVNEAKLRQQADVRQAESDVRAAQTAIASAEEALRSAQAAADQAHRVVDIVNVSFRAGASTNIEVIDAQRASLDADTSVAQAEDQLRQAKLALLVAVGQFQ